MKPGTARFLEKLQTAGSFRMISNLRATASMRNEISHALGKFLEYHTEGKRELKSLQFLDKIKLYGVR